ncbi:Protein of unknown function [Pyronema omphalodes CBS 100304]|uniref:Uncharacterized protein n=1 Tax=Pyronema omphalodes (strain CBS 100304) TaxID=1076935 RepID=U4LNG0_PYROM|nr:Protein of unknown function [Pyronema omphalodes CBS 100304]
MGSLGGEEIFGFTKIPEGTRFPNRSFYAESMYFGSHELWIPEDSVQISTLPQIPGIPSIANRLTRFQNIPSANRRLGIEPRDRETTIFGPCAGKIGGSGRFLFFGSKYLHYGYDRTGELEWRSSFGFMAA